MWVLFEDLRGLRGVLSTNEYVVYQLSVDEWFYIEKHNGEHIQMFLCEITSVTNDVKVWMGFA